MVCSTPTVRRPDQQVQLKTPPSSRQARAKSIDLRATLRSTDELSQSLKREMQATSPVVRDSLTSPRTEREAQKLLRDTRR